MEKATGLRKESTELLKIWCDRLLELQVGGTGEKRLDGAFLCPACQVIHGRCQEMIYPLLCLAEHTGEMHYRDAALRLFDWGESLVCDDGSIYNDGQSAWNGITVFAAASLWESLAHHGKLLDLKDRERFAQRMHRAGQWVYKTITVDFDNNINYRAGAASVMAMLGIWEENESYLERARELSAFCLEHITVEGLLYGEGCPVDSITPRGCRPVDIGYNVEESLPALLTCARLLRDQTAQSRIREVFRSHLDFMMPDGGWDNSFGTRNFKWTYWGSRTSDGSLAAFAYLGQEEPCFAEAAWRNLQLMKKCTIRGLLAGGMDYGHFGEPACIHHSFSHAKVLAEVIDGGEVSWNRQHLPAEEAEGLRYYPSIDTYRIFTEKLMVTATASDFAYLKGGHASGGTISMAWHQDFGVILASSMTIYSLHEAHNMQQINRKSMHQSLTPEAEYKKGGKLYRQCFDTEVKMQGEWRDGKALIFTEGRLRDEEHGQPEAAAGYQLIVETGASEIIIQGTLRAEKEFCPSDFSYILPVTFRHHEVLRQEKESVTFIREGKLLKVDSDTEIQKAEPIFNLAGGFEALKLTVLPDEKGKIRLRIYTP